MINALTDEFHPCQILADLQTMREHKGRLAGVTLSLFRRRGQQHGQLLPAGGRDSGPARRDRRTAQVLPDPAVLDRAPPDRRRTGGSVTVTTDAEAAADGADVLATDTWVSMGQEDRGDRPRETALRPFALDRTAARARGAPTRSCCTACPPTGAKRSTPT